MGISFEVQDTGKAMKMLKPAAVVVLLLAISMILSACGGSAAEESSDDVIISGKVDSKYTERDLSGDWDTAVASETQLSDESVTITKEGVYIFSGTLEDGQIIVDAQDTDKVQIVLNGAEISCSDGPAILVENADKTFITLAEGSENSVADGTDYSSDEDEPWGAIFSRDTLTINGSGSLTVMGNYQNGIVSKDDLKITGGIISVTAKDDGIRGRDSVRIYDGEITVTAEGDGIKANNDEDEEKGYVSVDGGSLTVSGVGSQGIDAYYVAQITGGTVEIDSENEGIQARVVYMQDGELNIKASDDCLNATNGNSDEKETAQEGVSVEIVGGTLNLSTEAGDGLDSNGDLTVSGGLVTVQGSSGGAEVPMDYNGEAVITGGTVFAAGNSSMAQNFGEKSTQCSLLYCGNNYEAGTQICLTDSDGKELASFTAERGFSAVLISTPDMVQGASYFLKIGENEETVTLDDIITGEGGMGGMGRDGMPQGPEGSDDRGGGFGPGTGELEGSDSGQPMQKPNEVTGEATGEARIQGEKI